MNQPSYNNPTKQQYLELLNQTALLVQLIEKYERLGLNRLAEHYRKLKEKNMIRIQDMKSALKIA